MRPCRWNLSFSVAVSRRASRSHAIVRTRAFYSVFCLLAADAALSLQHEAHAATCDAIVGKWSWFAGGEVTINPDGTFVQQSGNGGHWQCADTDAGKITLTWRQGGHVNRMALSADGNGLSSTDPSQSFVTARRIALRPRPRINPKPLRLRKPARPSRKAAASPPQGTAARRSRRSTACYGSRSSAARSEPSM